MARSGQRNALAPPVTVPAAVVQYAQGGEAMREDKLPPILPTPLKGTLKKEDIIRAVEKAKAKRLKKEEEARLRSAPR
jgi:hypothetical protein